MTRCSQAAEGNDPSGSPKTALATRIAASRNASACFTTSGLTPVLLAARAEKVNKIPVNKQRVIALLETRIDIRIALAAGTTQCEVSRQGSQGNRHTENHPTVGLSGRPPDRASRPLTSGSWHFVAHMELYDPHVPHRYEAIEDPLALHLLG